MNLYYQWDYTAKTAIDQIKMKNYPDVLKDYGKNILLVGICYDKHTKKHDCIIESVKY